MQLDALFILDPEVQRFIAKHEQADVTALALKKAPNDGWDYPLVLDQIKSRQKAAIKLPEWWEQRKKLVFPTGSLLEQASSTATARYKASLTKGKSFIDLGAGAGVDSWAFSEFFPEGVCVEHDPYAASLLAHNLKILFKNPPKIICEPAENFVKTMPETDLVYIDPQRRNKDRKGFYKLQDCTPNICELLPSIKTKTRRVMLKASPMLDIHTAIRELECVAQVHIVEWRGECREVLYVLDFEYSGETAFRAVALDDLGKAATALTFTQNEEKAAKAPLSLPLEYLYEPGPAFQKSGAFNFLATKFDVKKLHKHTHLYTSEKYRPDFPGRHFRIEAVLPVDRKSLKFDKANLALRNFPSDVANLRKRLQLKEGGETYLFACTLENDKKALIQCHKQSK